MSDADPRGPAEQPLVPTVHARGEMQGLDHVFDLVRYVVQPRPLTECLDDLPRRMAAVFDASVCSIYLREGDDLVMRGNVGFPANALGDVRLGIGEGITGMAVECMRPLSLDVAPAHERFRPFPALDEGRFPILLAVPVPGPQGPVGALVLQRRDPPAFDETAIQLAAALTAPISAVIERAKLVDALRQGGERVSRGSRRVTLAGRTAVRGRAFGRAATPPRAKPTGSSREAPAHEDVEQALKRVVRRTRRLLGPLGRKAEQLRQDVSLFALCHTALDDTRLHSRVLEMCGQGMPLTDALIRAGVETVRAATRSADGFAVQRAELIGELCEAMALLATPGPSHGPQRGAVLVTDRLTITDLLLARPRALVVGAGGDQPAHRAIAAVLGSPTVVGVVGLFNWVSPGDTLIVDADHGLVRVSPGRAELAALREQQRRPSSS